MVTRLLVKIRAGKKIYKQPFSPKMTKNNLNKHYFNCNSIKYTNTDLKCVFLNIKKHMWGNMLCKGFKLTEMLFCCTADGARWLVLVPTQADSTVHRS